MSPKIAEPRKKLAPPPQPCAAAPAGYSVAATLWRAAAVVGLLYMFLVGVQTLGGSIKFMGAGFAEGVMAVQANPLLSLMAGVLATCLLQSSSVTTSMVVGFVSAGVMTIEGAVPMIMGANIGTSVTNTLVSLGCVRDRDHFKRAFAAATVHDCFNFLSVAVLLPIELSTGLLSKSARALAALLYGNAAGISYKSPIKAALKPAAAAIKGLVTKTLALDGVAGGAVMMVVAAALIVGSLLLIVRLMRALLASKQSAVVDRLLSRNAYLAMVFGVLLTCAVQSSSITTSLLVPMAGVGVLTLDAVFPVTVGANIGTTMTALLAALAGNIAGLGIALVHLLFNLAGAVLWFVHPRMRRIPLGIAEKLGEMAYRNRLIALGYVGAAFFLLPLALVGLGR